MWRARRPGAGGRDQEGASLVEVLVAVALLGILCNLAIHSALEYKRRAEAASVVADFRLFRDAVTEHYTRCGEWPAERARQEEPPELSSSLAGKLRFSQPELGLAYDWDNWVREDGTFRWAETGVACGFTVVIPKERQGFERIFDDIDELYEGPLVRVGRRRLTFVIQPIPGARD